MRALLFKGSRITRLRRRFVGYALAAVAAVLLVVGLAVNLAYDASTQAGLDGLLARIAQSQGVFGQQRSEEKILLSPKDADELSDGVFDDGFESDSDTDADSNDLETLWGDWDWWEDWGKSGGASALFGERPVTPETAYATRWFQVTYDGAGNVAYLNLSHIASVNEADLPRFVQVAARAGEGFGSVGDFRYLVVTIGDYHQAFFLDATTEFYAMRSLAALTALVGIIAFGVIALAIWFLSGRAVRPVAEADARQRRFVTDASHELKTPLAVIMTSLSVAKMEVGENRFLQKAMDQSARMGELVDELVGFARIDEGEDREPALFDASVACKEVVTSFVDYAAEKGHTLEFSIEDGLDYMGDEYGVRRLVSVLVDNAVKYSAPGGKVALSLERWRRHGLRLVCENPVEAIDEATLPQLFERFWRPDDSRSRETGGFGIGLSIAREVAEQAGGTITAALSRKATDASPAIIRFEALLP